MGLNYFNEKVLTTKYARYGFRYEYACFMAMQHILDKRRCVANCYLVRSRQNG